MITGTNISGGGGVMLSSLLLVRLLLSLFALCSLLFRVPLGTRRAFGTLSWSVGAVVSLRCFISRSLRIVSRLSRPCPLLVRRSRLPIAHGHQPRHERATAARARTTCHRPSNTFLTQMTRRAQLFLPPQPHKPVRAARAATCSTRGRWGRRGEDKAGSGGGGWGGVEEWVVWERGARGKRYVMRSLLLGEPHPTPQPPPRSVLSVITSCCDRPCGAQSHIRGSARTGSACITEWKNIADRQFARNATKQQKSGMHREGGVHPRSVLTVRGAISLAPLVACVFPASLFAIG